MNDGEITIGIAANTVYAQPQFQSPVFQTVCFDKKSGHSSKLIGQPMLSFPLENVEGFFILSDLKSL